MYVIEKYSENILIINKFNALRLMLTSIFYIDIHFPDCLLFMNNLYNNIVTMLKI